MIRLCFQRNKRLIFLLFISLTLWNKRIISLRVWLRKTFFNIIHLKFSLADTLTEIILWSKFLKRIKKILEERNERRNDSQIVDQTSHWFLLLLPIYCNFKRNPRASRWFTRTQPFLLIKLQILLTGNWNFRAISLTVGCQMF